MTRAEVEIKLNQDRAWVLETWGAMPAEELTRGRTVSRHDPESLWSAQDHLTHLAGIEAALWLGHESCRVVAFHLPFAVHHAQTKFSETL